MAIHIMIPAKGESARLPGKNLLPWPVDYEQKIPLVAWAVERAGSDYSDYNVAVSTDDQRVVEAVQYLGARVVLRPSYMCHCLSPDQLWLEHAARSEGVVDSDIIVILRVTSPFFTTDYLEAALEEFRRAGDAVDSLRPLRLATEHPGKMWFIDHKKTGLATPALTESVEAFNFATQMLPHAYVQTGAIEIFRAGLLKQGRHTGDHVIPFFTNDPLADLDINTRHDYDRAVAIREVQIAQKEEERDHDDDQ